MLKWLPHLDSPSTPSAVSVVRHYLNVTSVRTLLRSAGYVPTSPITTTTAPAHSSTAATTTTTAVTNAVTSIPSSAPPHNHSFTKSASPSRGLPSGTATASMRTPTQAHTATPVTTPEEVVWQIVATSVNTTLVEINKEQLWAVQALLDRSKSQPANSSAAATNATVMGAIDAIVTSVSASATSDADPQLIPDETGWRQVVTSEGTHYFLLESGVIYDDSTPSDDIRSDRAPTYSRKANETFAEFELRYNAYYHARGGVRGSEVNVLEEEIYFNLWPNAAAYVAGAKEALRAVLQMQSTHDGPTTKSASHNDFENAFRNTVLGYATSVLPTYTSPVDQFTTHTQTAEPSSMNQTHSPSKTRSLSPTESQTDPFVNGGPADSSPWARYSNTSSTPPENITAVAEQLRCYPNLPSPFQARAKWIGPPPMFGFVLPPKPVYHIPDFVNGVPRAALTQQTLNTLANDYQARLTSWKAKVQEQLTHRDNWLKSGFQASTGFTREDFFAVLNTCEASNELGAADVARRNDDIVMVGDLTYAMDHIADFEEVAWKEIWYEETIAASSGGASPPTSGPSSPVATTRPSTAHSVPTTAVAEGTTPTTQPHHQPPANTTRNETSATHTRSNNQLTHTATNASRINTETETVSVSQSIPITETVSLDATQSSSFSETGSVVNRLVRVNRTYIRYNRQNSIRNIYRWSTCRRSMFQVRFPRAGLWVACHGTNLPKPLAPSNHSDALRNASADTPVKSNATSPTDGLTQAVYTSDELGIFVAQTTTNPQQPALSPVQRADAWWYTNPIQRDVRGTPACITSSQETHEYRVNDPSAPQIRPVSQAGADAALPWHETTPYLVLKSVAVIQRGTSGFLERPTEGDTAALKAMYKQTGLPASTDTNIAFSNLLMQALNMRLRQIQAPDWLLDFPMYAEPLYMDWLEKGRLKEVPTIRRFHSIDELFLPAFVAASSLEPPPESPHVSTNIPSSVFGPTASFDVTGTQTSRKATMSSLVVVAPYEVKFADITNDPDQLSSAGTVRYTFNGRAAPCEYSDAYMTTLFSGRTRLPFGANAYRWQQLLDIKELLRVYDSSTLSNTFDRVSRAVRDVSTYLTDMKGLQQLYSPSLTTESQTPWASCTSSMMDSYAPFVYSRNPDVLETAALPQYVDAETGRRVTSSSRDGGGGFWPQYDMMFFLRLNRTCGEGMHLLRRKVLNPLRRLAAQQYTLGDMPLGDLRASVRNLPTDNMDYDDNIPLGLARVPPAAASRLPYRRPNRQDRVNADGTSRLPARGVLFPIYLDPSNVSLTLEAQQEMYRHLVAALRPFSQRLALPSAMLMSCSSGGPQSSCRPRINATLTVTSPRATSTYATEHEVVATLPPDMQLIWWCDGQPSASPLVGYCSPSTNLTSATYGTLTVQLEVPTSASLIAAASAHGTPPDYLLAANNFSCPGGMPSWLPFILNPSEAVAFTSILPLESEAFLFPFGVAIGDDTVSSASTDILSHASPFVQAIRKIQSSTFTQQPNGDAGNYEAPAFQLTTEAAVEAVMVNGSFSISPNGPSFYRSDAEYGTQRCFLSGRLVQTSAAALGTGMSVLVEVPCDSIPLAHQPVRNTTAQVMLSKEELTSGGFEKVMTSSSYRALSLVEETIQSFEYNDLIPLTEASRIEEDALINVARYVKAMKVRLASFEQQFNKSLDAAVRTGMTAAKLSPPASRITPAMVLSDGDTSPNVRSELAIPIQMFGSLCSPSPTPQFATKNVTTTLRLTKVTNSEMGAPLFAFPHVKSFCLYNCDECQSCGTHKSFTGSTSLCLTAARGLLMYNPGSAMHMFASSQLKGPQKADYLVDQASGSSSAMTLVPYDPLTYVATYRIDALPKPTWNFFATVSDLTAIPELQRGQIQRVLVRGAGLVPALGILANDGFVPGDSRIDRLIAALDECTPESTSQEAFRASAEGKIISYQRVTDYYDVSGLPTSSTKALISTMTEVYFEIPTNWLDANDMSFKSSTTTTTTAAPSGPVTTPAPPSSYHYTIGRVPGTGNYTSKWGAYDGIRYKHNSREYFLLCYFSARSQSWQEAGKFYLRPRLDLSRTYPDKPVIPITWSQTIKTASLTSTQCGGWIRLWRQSFKDTEFRSGSVIFDVTLEGGNNAFQSVALDYINRFNENLKRGGTGGGNGGVSPPAAPDFNGTNVTTLPPHTTSTTTEAPQDTKASAPLSAVYLDNYAERVYGIKVESVQLISDARLRVTVGQIALHVFPEDVGGPYGIHEMDVLKALGLADPLQEFLPAAGTGFLRFRMFINPMVLLCSPRSEDTRQRSNAAAAASLDVANSKRRLLSAIDSGASSDVKSPYDMPKTQSKSPTPPPAAVLHSQTLRSQSRAASRTISPQPPQVIPTKTVMGNPDDLDGDPLSEGFVITQDYHTQYSLQHGTTIAAAVAGGLGALVGSVITFGAVGLGTSGTMPLFMGPQLIASFELLTCRPSVDLSISSDLLSTINPIAAFYFGVTPSIYTSSEITDPSSGKVVIPAGGTVGGKEYGTNRVALGCIGCAFAIFAIHLMMVMLYRYALRDCVLKRTRAIHRRVERENFRKEFARKNPQLKSMMSIRRADFLFDSLVCDRRAKRYKEHQRRREDDELLVLQSHRVTPSVGLRPSDIPSKASVADVERASVSIREPEPFSLDDGGATLQRRPSLENISIGECSDDTKIDNIEGVRPQQQRRRRLSLSTFTSPISEFTESVGSALGRAKRIGLGSGGRDINRSIGDGDAESDVEFFKENPSTYDEAAAALLFPSLSIVFFSYFFLGAMLFSLRYVVSGDSTVADPFGLSPVSSLSDLTASVSLGSVGSLASSSADGTSVFLRTIQDGDTLIDKYSIIIAETELLSDAFILGQKILGASVIGISLIFVMAVWRRVYTKTTVQIRGLSKGRLQQADTLTLRRQAKEASKEENSPQLSSTNRAGSPTAHSQGTATVTVEQSPAHNNHIGGNDDLDALSPKEKVEKLLNGLGPVLSLYLNTEEGYLRYFDSSMATLYDSFRTPVAMLAAARSNSAYSGISKFLKRWLQAQSTTNPNVDFSALFGKDQLTTPGHSPKSLGPNTVTFGNSAVDESSASRLTQSQADADVADPWPSELKARLDSDTKWSPTERESWSGLVRNKLLFLVHPSWVQRGGKLLHVRGQWLPTYPHLFQYISVLFPLQIDNVFGYALPFAAASLSSLITCIPKSIISSRCTVQGILIVIVMGITALTIMVRRPERLFIDNIISALHYVALGCVAISVSTGEEAYNSLLLLATLFVTGTIFAKVITTAFMFYVYDQACSAKMISVRQKLVSQHKKRLFVEKRFVEQVEQQRALGAMLAELDIWDGVEGLADEDQNFSDISSRSSDGGGTTKAATADKPTKNAVLNFFRKLFPTDDTQNTLNPEELARQEIIETNESHLAEWRKQYRLLEAPVHEGYGELDLAEQSAATTATRMKGIQQAPLDIDDLFLIDDDPASSFNSRKAANDGDLLEMDSFDDNVAGNYHNTFSPRREIQYDFHFDDLDDNDDMNLLEDVEMGSSSLPHPAIRRRTRTLTAGLDAPFLTPLSAANPPPTTILRELHNSSISQSRSHNQHGYSQQSGLSSEYSPPSFSAPAGINFRTDPVNPQQRELSDIDEDLLEEILNTNHQFSALAPVQRPYGFVGDDTQLEELEVNWEEALPALPTLESDGEMVDRTTQNDDSTHERSSVPPTELAPAASSPIPNLIDRSQIAAARARDVLRRFYDANAEL